MCNHFILRQIFREACPWKCIKKFTFSIPGSHDKTTNQKRSYEISRLKDTTHTSQGDQHGKQPWALPLLPWFKYHGRKIPNNVKATNLIQQPSVVVNVSCCLEQILDTSQQPVTP